MRLCPFIIILSLLGWGLDARAQLPEEQPTSMPEQWQLTLDVIKSKAQNLVIENNGLQVEYQKLTGRAQELQQSIDNQQQKNEQAENSLKERRGQTDQQTRIAELTQMIKTKSQQSRAYDEQLEKLNRKQYLIREEEYDWQGQKRRPPSAPDAGSPAVDDQLVQLRKQLEDESTQEVLLENELGALKNGDKTPKMDVNTIEAQNKDLESSLDSLRLQKAQYEKKTPATQSSQANARKYDQLKKRKDQLEASIYVYEMRMDQGLSESSLTALAWPLKKKSLVHEMVLVDGRNNQMRDQIKVLHEDIDVLRDQTAKLERRVDFAQGQAAKQ